jgi:hypothetical protein
MSFEQRRACEFRTITSHAPHTTSQAPHTTSQAPHTRKSQNAEEMSLINFRSVMAARARRKTAEHNVQARVRGHLPDTPGTAWQWTSQMKKTCRSRLRFIEGTLVTIFPAAKAARDEMERRKGVRSFASLLGFLPVFILMPYPNSSQQPPHDVDCALWVSLVVESHLATRNLLGKLDGSGPVRHLLERVVECSLLFDVPRSCCSNNPKSHRHAWPQRVKWQCRFKKIVGHDKRRTSWHASP